MKQFSKAFTLLLLVLVSCASDDSIVTPEDSSPVLSRFIYEVYNTVNSPNTVRIRRTYTVESNRILSAIRENVETGSIGERTYNYTNGRITEISNFNNGLLTDTNYFTYDTDGNLTEYLSVPTENANQMLYVKLNYTHEQDTIYGISSQSNDGITYEITASSKIVLDANMNKTFSELFSAINGETTRNLITYDANNNMISSMGFQKQSDGTFLNTITSSYTYESGINTLGLVYDATYGRQVLMLSNQHFDNSSAINNYNAKYSSYNTFEAYTTSFFGNVNFTPEFINTFNTNNYSIMTDYSMAINNELISRFTYEFIFE